MNHREYLRIVPGARQAVLFLHGILGSPVHFQELIALVPDTVSVQALLLEGHGGGVRDFSRASMARWQAQVDSAVTKLLETHDHVCIAAHSMGTLFAIGQGVKRPRHIPKLFLLAVPLQVGIKGRMLQNAWQVFWGSINQSDPEAVATQRVCSVSHSKRLWLYLGWIPRYLELFALIRRTRSMLAQLKVPCTAFQSARDEMVSAKAVEILKMHPQIQCAVLPDSSHNYYSPADSQILRSAFTQWLQ